ncbi:MAG: flagellin [Vampirovibrionia bacterium]
MGLTIYSYDQSLTSQRLLYKQTTTLNNLAEQLSTSYKINSASDNASGLMISETLLTNYSGTLMARANIEDTNSLLSTAEADLTSIKENLQAIRDLSIQGGNDTNSQTERDAINSEIQSRLDEINRISNYSSYNDKKLLDGSLTSLNVQTGSESDDTLTIDGSVLTDASTSSLGITVDATSITTHEEYDTLREEVDTALESTEERISNIGSYSSQLNDTNLSLSITSGNLLASESQIRDTDIASAMSYMVNLQILQKASMDVLYLSNKNMSKYSELIQ